MRTVTRTPDIGGTGRPPRRRPGRANALERTIRS